MTFDATKASPIQSQLRPGEKLLWAGRPGAGIRLRPMDWFFLPFSLLWLGFALFWEGSSIAAGAPVFFLLFGLFLVVIGFFIAFGRFLLDARIRQLQTYAVTSDRLIVASLFPRHSVQSFDLRNLPALTLTKRSGGEGTISFGQPSSFGWSTTNTWGPWLPAYLGASFEFIPDAARIYDLALDAQKKARAA